MNLKKVKKLLKKQILIPIFIILFISILIPIVSNYFEVLKKCFNKDYSSIDIGCISIIICFIFLLVIFNIYSTIKNRKIEKEGVRIKEKDATFGSANWATIDEARDFLSVGKEDGLIFGKTEKNETISLPQSTFLNKNVAIFGSSGSKKTRAFALINILKQAELGNSIICTDSKSELYKKTCKYLEKKGYNVKILNLVNPDYSDCWNPIYEVENDTDAQVFSEIVIANTELAGNKSGDQFWTRSEQNLLKALILHIALEVDDEQKKNMRYLYSILASGNLKNVDAVFTDSKGATKASYNIYAQATDIVKQSIVTGLATRLQIFQTDDINAMTMLRDIDLELPGKEKCAYFCVSSDMDSTFDFLAGLFFSFLFIKLVRKADRNISGRLEKETYFILDEFPNIGRIPSFEKKISTLRSRGINTSIIFQSIAQLKNRYPNDTWQEILGNTDSKLCMGCNDIASASYVTSILGTSTITTESIRKENGFDGNFTLGMLNEGTSQRNLMNPDELIKLDNDKLIIIIRGQKPLIAYKYDYSEHILSQDIEEIEIEKYKKKLDIDKILESMKIEDNDVKERRLPSFDEFLGKKVRI